MESVARPRKFDEDQVVRASRDVFWSQGYAGTSVGDLGEATGLGRGTFYHTFGDKHAIFLRNPTTIAPRPATVCAPSCVIRSA